MNKAIYCLTLVICSLPATAADKPPSELLGGYSHGFAMHATTSPDHQRVEFKNASKKTLLVMTGPAAEKWSKWEEILGPCYVFYPKIMVKNQRGKSAEVFRFRGGVIIAYDGKAFVLSPQIVMSWEINGGAKGKLGFPTTDTMPFMTAPPINQPQL